MRPWKNSTKFNGDHNMIAAVKVRSSIDARDKAKDTLQTLNLNKNNQVKFLEDTKANRGMLQVAKDYISFGKVSDETVSLVEDKTGNEIENGTVISLSPPSKGYSSTKKHVNQGGVLGENPEIESLIERMV